MRILRTVVVLLAVQAAIWAVLAAIVPGCDTSSIDSGFTDVGPALSDVRPPADLLAAPADLGPSAPSGNVAPVCSLRTNPDPPRAAVGDTIRLNACGSTDADGDPIRIAIDCGNGQPITQGCTAECRYSAPGGFTADACCDDQHGHGGICTDVAVQIEAPSPSASPSGSPSSPGDVMITSLGADPGTLFPGQVAFISGRVSPAGATWTLQVTSGFGTLSVTSGTGPAIGSQLTASPTQVVPITVTATATFGGSVATRSITLPVI
jgi:hypothetical protein